MVRKENGKKERDIITRFLLPLSRQENLRSQLEIFAHCHSRLALSAVAETRFQGATLYFSTKDRVPISKRCIVMHEKPRKRMSFCDLSLPDLPLLTFIVPRIVSLCSRKLSYLVYASFSLIETSYKRCYLTHCAGYD